MSKTDLYNQLIEFNKKEQIESRIDLCNRKPQLNVCNHVTQNTYEKWSQYYSHSNYKNLFSKGQDRFEKWKKLESMNFENSVINQQLITIMNSNKHKFYFIIAALIIIFQVFGDANHRTGRYYYKKNTNSTLNDTQETMIKNILREFEYTTMNDNKLSNIITKLNQSSIPNSVRGGKKSRKNKTKRCVTRRRKEQ